MQESAQERMLDHQLKQRLHTLDQYVEPAETFRLTPMQADYMEELFNEAKDDWNLGYMLIPVRQPEQTLFKNIAEKKTAGFPSFDDEEKMSLMQFYKDLDLVRKKVGSKYFHWFLTLQQLRRHPLSKYFMALPDPLYLQLYNFSEVVPEALDIRTIANRLLKGSYQSKEDFETAMVTMIHSFRVYFINDMAMFDISIKFEMIFWSIYKNEKLHQQALRRFLFWKKKCTQKRQRTTKEYKHQRRKSLIRQYNKLEMDRMYVVQALLLEGPLKINNKALVNNELNIGKMSDNACKFFEGLLEKEKDREVPKRQRGRSRERGMGRGRARERGSKEKNETVQKVETIKKAREQKMKVTNSVFRTEPNQAYELFFSDEEDEEDEKKKDSEDEDEDEMDSKQYLKQVIDNMAYPDFGSDDD